MSLELDKPAIEETGTPKEKRTCHKRKAHEDVLLLCQYRDFLDEFAGKDRNVWKKV